MSFLKEILAVKKIEVKALKKIEAQLSLDLAKAESGRFYKALSADTVNVIAEIKKASPSMGVIRKDVDIISFARIYETAGANAISVLTDKKFFQGDIEFLKQVKQTVKIPVLRKDFIIHPLQLFEARQAGADAVLLIAAALSSGQLKKLYQASLDLGMDVLLEIHDEDDLKKALKTEAPLIGINNRSLKTFQINLNTALKLFPKIPSDRQVVVESGINSLRELQIFLEVGMNRFLVGKYLMEQSDPGAVLKTIKNARTF